MMRLLVGAASIAIIAASTVYLGGEYSAHASNMRQAKADASVMMLANSRAPASRICATEQSAPIQSADVLDACVAAGYN